MVMPSDRAEFIHKTNDDVEAWMDSFYIEGRKSEFSMHCLWAWQEQERRHRKVQADLLEALESAELLFACQCNDATSSGWLGNARAAIAKARGEA